LNSAAFTRAERTRRRSQPVSAPQRRKLAYLARIAEIEMPVVHWAHQASDAIERLEGIVRQPTLDLHKAL
jgi:hypothetical protein